jgi:hypothetical protein
MHRPDVTGARVVSRGERSANKNSKVMALHAEKLRLDDLFQEHGLTLGGVARLKHLPTDPEPLQQWSPQQLRCEVSQLGMALEVIKVEGLSSDLDIDNIIFKPVPAWEESLLENLVFEKQQEVARKVTKAFKSGIKPFCPNQHNAGYDDETREVASSVSSAWTHCKARLLHYIEFRAACG